MTDREKEIILSALDSYYAQIMSLIVSKEKPGNTEHDLRKLKLEISTLLRKFED